MVRSNKTLQQLTWGTVSSLALASAVHAEILKTHFNIASQPTEDALVAFAASVKLQLVFEPQLVAGMRSPALVGDYSTDDGLRQLLLGTDLEFLFVTDNTLVIRRRTSRADAQANGGFIRLAQVDDATTRAQTTDPALATVPPAAAPQGSGIIGSTGVELQEVIVRATRFSYESADSAFKMPLSLKDTPATVKVITQDLLDFATIRKFEDLYKVDASGGVSHAGDQFPRNYYRGFRQQGINAIKVDGFRMSANINLDLSTFERFEVVKGATSTLYGQNSVSGTLNAISRQPTDDFGAELDLEAGSYEHYRVQGDVHGPLGNDSGLTYRLVGAYQDANSPQDFVDSRVISVAPTLKYQIGDDTAITARVIHQTYDFTPYFGFGAQFIGTDSSDPAQLVPGNFIVPDVPRSRSGAAPWNQTKKDATFAQTVLEHKFESDWQLRGSLQYQDVSGKADAFQTWNTDENGDTFSYLYGRDQDSQVYAAEVNLFGDVEVLGHAQTLFFGADYAQLDTDTLDLGQSGPADFSILNPDWSSIPAHRVPADYDSISQTENRREIYGVTAQLLARPIDGLIVSLGARYSHDEVKNRARFGTPDELNDFTALPYGAWSELRQSKVTMQGGITYALTANLNAYASYGQTFEPRSGRVFDNNGGHFVGPEEGEAYELGLKGEALGGRLSYSMALFEMERTNILQPDLLNPGFVLAIGTQRSRGVEIDFQGRIAPGWEIYGSIAKLDAEFVEGRFAGLPSANAPDFGVSLFGSYQVQSGALRNLGIGAGVVHKSGMETFDNSFGRPVRFDLGDFTEVDLRVFYDLANWRYEVSATNLLDTTYYSPYAEAMWFGLAVNPPRLVTGRVSYRF